MYNTVYPLQVDSQEEIENEIIMATMKSCLIIKAELTCTCLLLGSTKIGEKSHCVLNE
jgi:hypothetical protein